MLWKDTFLVDDHQLWLDDDIGSFSEEGRKNIKRNERYDLKMVWNHHPSIEWRLPMHTFSLKTCGVSDTNWWPGRVGFQRQLHPAHWAEAGGLPDIPPNGSTLDQFLEIHMGIITRPTTISYIDMFFYFFYFFCSKYFLFNMRDLNSNSVVSWRPALRTGRLDPTGMEATGLRNGFIGAMG